MRSRIGEGVKKMKWGDISQWVYMFIIATVLATQLILIKTNHSRIELSKQQHAELMQELKKQTEYLRQIAENTAKEEG